MQWKFCVKKKSQTFVRDFYEFQYFNLRSQITYSVPLLFAKEIKEKEESICVEESVHWFTFVEQI